MRLSGWLDFSESVWEWITEAMWTRAVETAGKIHLNYLHNINNQILFEFKRLHVRGKKSTLLPPTSTRGCNDQI